MASAEESKQHDSGDMAATHLPSIQEIAEDTVYKVPMGYVGRQELATLTLVERALERIWLKACLISRSYPEFGCLALTF